MVISVYAPSPGSLEKIAARIEWNKILGTYLRKLHKEGWSLILLGDVNVTEHSFDCTLPDEWKADWLQDFPATTPAERNSW